MADAKPRTLSDEFASKLAALDTTAARLNKASNSINDSILTVENFVAGLGVGLEVWLRTAVTKGDAEGSPRGESVWSEQRLGYSRLNGKWCLALKWFRVHTGFFEGDTNCPYQNEYSDGEAIPLTQASREARIAALGLLPDLVSELNAAAETALEKIEKANQLFG